MTASSVTAAHLLQLAHPLRQQVSVDGHALRRCVAKKLEVDLVMRRAVVAVRRGGQVERGDNAAGVTRWKLRPDGECAVHVVLLGL